MAQKRKSAYLNALEESERTLNCTFRSAANSLSQLYEQGFHQQKLLFHAGKRHALEKLNEWILMSLQGGVSVTDADIITYLQKELDNGVEVPDVPVHEQQRFNMNASVPLSAPVPQMQEGTLLPETGPLVVPVDFNMEQPKNSASSSDASSTPVEGSIPFEVADYSELLARSMQI